MQRQLKYIRAWKRKEKLLPTEEVYYRTIKDYEAARAYLFKISDEGKKQPWAKVALLEQHDKQVKEILKMEYRLALADAEWDSYTRKANSKMMIRDRGLDEKRAKEERGYREERQKEARVSKERAQRGKRERTERD